MRWVPILFGIAALYNINEPQGECAYPHIAFHLKYLVVIAWTITLQLCFPVEEDS